MKNKTTIILMLIILIFISQQNISVLALDDHAGSTLDAIELPPDLNLNISNTCSGHKFFEQAAANESGYFAIFALHVDPDALADVDFQKVYIDIYQPDGTFLQELSFATRQAFALAMEENCVDIIFRNSILIYNFISQELAHFAIPTESEGNGLMYDQLNGKKFTAGEWEYTCKKGFLGYVKLSRTNGEQKQMLLEMTSNQLNSLELIIPGAVGGLIIIAAVNYRKKRVKNR